MHPHDAYVVCGASPHAYSNSHFKSLVPTNNSNYKLFQGVCWAFGPGIRAFKHYRPVIGIDATFLLGRYKGRLITACDYDAGD
jgi:hypothetical protein